MKFGLFVYCTIGRRAELEAGMAGCNPELYHRMLAELGDLATFAEVLDHLAENDFHRHDDLLDFSRW